MIVLAFLFVMLGVLAPLAWLCDRYPTVEQRSVEDHDRQMRALGGRRG